MSIRSLLPVLLLSAGCAEAPTGPVLNPTVSRSPVVFESARGQSTFEKAVTERYRDGGGYIQSMHARLSKNAFFNQNVQLADTDGDGIISDREAQEYAESEN
jgi:hypothetical protein